MSARTVSEGITDHSYRKKRKGDRIPRTALFPGLDSGERECNVDDYCDLIFAFCS